MSSRKAGTRVPPPTTCHSPSPLVYPIPKGSLSPTGCHPSREPLCGHDPLWEGHIPLPTHSSHRLPEVTPPPTRARLQNHWFAAGPRAPQGTLSPPCDTVATRATGSQGLHPRPAAHSLSTASIHRLAGGHPGVALARRSPYSLGHPPAQLALSTSSRYRRPHAPQHLHQRVPSVYTCTLGAPPPSASTRFSLADDRRPPTYGSSCGFTRPTVTPAGSALLDTSSTQPSWARDSSQRSPRPPTARLGGLASHDRRSALQGHTMSNTRDQAIRQGPSSPPLPVPPNREAGQPPRPGTTALPTSLRSTEQVVAPPSSYYPHRKRSSTLLDFWPSMRPGKTGRPMPTTLRGDPAPRGDRRRPQDSAATDRPTKLLRPSSPLLPGSDCHYDRGPVNPGPAPLLPTSPADVLFVGPAVPPALQAVSPSGDVRLTLRRYSAGDSLTSPHILLRLDLRIHPRDLYSIPSDGHCGFHTLTVLTHPLYPTPPPLLTVPRFTTSCCSVSKL